MGFLPTCVTLSSPRLVIDEGDAGAALSSAAFCLLRRASSAFLSACHETFLVVQIKFFQKSSVHCVSRCLQLTVHFILFYFFARFYFPASGQAVVTGFVPAPPRFLPSTIFIAHRVQQSHCSSVLHRVLLTQALALSASQFVHEKKSPRIFTSMHSAGSNSRN